MKAFIYRVIVLIWNIWPFKKMLASFIRASSWLKHKLYKDLRFKGVMKLKGDGIELQLFNPGNTTLENELFWNGIFGWEKVTLRLWTQFSKNATTILDIGANSGYFSILAGAVNSKAAIFAFEPVERTARLLKENIIVNDFKNIELFEMAVSNENGFALFYDTKTESQYSASLSSDMFESPDKVEYKVETIKLDDFHKLDKKNIDLVKIDVETFEPQVLQGMLGLVAASTPIMLIEILNPKIGIEVGNLLQPFGYIFYEIDENKGITLTDKLGFSANQNYLALVEKDLDVVEPILQSVMQ